MGILDADKCDDNSRKIPPNLLPRKGECLPIKSSIGKVELNEWNVLLKMEVSMPE